MTLKHNDELREGVNEILAETGHQFKGTVEVKHFAMVLKDELGFKKVESKVVNPLEGLKVAGHTGCHIVSPSEFMRFDDPLDPVVLDEMVRVIGADPLVYDLKTLCCGWTLTNYGDKDATNKLLGDKLGTMRDAGADCITAICPQCFYQFDTGQVLAARSLNLDFKIPVLFYTQLLALAMGYSLDDIGYQRHRVKDLGFEDRIRMVTP
jgi:heterodisulfide reductase subunit B